MEILSQHVQLKKYETHNQMAHHVAEFVITEHRPKSYTLIRLSSKSIDKTTLTEMINGWLTPFEIKFDIVHSKHHARYGINIKSDKKGYTILAVLRGEERLEEIINKIVLGLFYDLEKNRLLCFRIK